jgi:hypothetical protein
VGGPIIRSAPTPLYIGGGVTTAEEEPDYQGMCPECGQWLSDSWEMADLPGLFGCYQCDSITEIPKVK